MAIRSFVTRQEKMPPRRGARRGGGREGGSRRDGAAISGHATGCFSTFARCPAYPAAPVQADIVPPPAPEGAQLVPVQLSAEAKHLRDFRKYNPKTFDGSMDNPTKAQMWLTSIETIFRYMKFPDDQKVQCAVFFLEDRGTTWWETAERMLRGDVSKITWEQFKESFYANFFSANVKHAKQQEFLNLEQGDMTVKQYDAEFDMLSRFALDVVRNEAVRTEKFVRALDLSLHERADPSKAAGRGSGLGQKRKVESQPALALQRDLRSGVECASGASNQDITPTFVLRNSLGLVRTSLPLHSREEFLPRLVKRPSELYTVGFYPIRGGHVVKRKDKGMDWLSANHASIDCFRKEVVFNPPSGTSFKFKGAGIICIPKIISGMKASKLLSQGTWSILASVVDTREPNVSLSSELVVREYPEVFPDELPGLPPPKEIDFAIELEPDTALISRAPYGMAPAELKELKVQLQELLDKGFIRPSVSP
ncbi:ty3-gypsy retrotransposon protein [Cucumis melo var. makuwa]|uniref:Ty3-gypsy retrotransposon protein n=1 Tax=Cucumis melo var. makuwa TaxID=1194695 RepID=A0A5D3CP03_CUCMM|nr:ty3-gypsy retrotransposon protein [Cucumis melo var. makuwa]